MFTLLVQVRSYWTLWQRPGTSFSAMSSPCCRPSSTQFRYTFIRSGFFVRALMVHSFAIFIGNILAGNIVREAIVSFLFPDLYWNIASSVFICFDCSGLGRPVLRMMAIVSLPRLSVCAGQGAVRPPASAAPLQEHHRPEREVRWRPLTASCSRAAFRHADAAYSSGMKTRSPAHKMALVLFYFYFILFFWFVRVIICNRADTQKLTSSSEMISSVQIMEFIGKKCRIKCIIKCNISCFYLISVMSANNAGETVPTGCNTFNLLLMLLVSLR